MKPYNIEIFDRNYNFRASALIDKEGFIHKYDWLVRENNSIIVPDYITIRLNEDTGSIGDNTVCTGDFIVIWTDDTDSAPYNSAQIVIKTESVKNGVQITYTDPMILFNHMAFVKIDDVKDMPTTQYIGQLITQEFGSNNPDIKQRISNLKVVYDYSEEKGFFEYTDTNDFYTVINLLDDLILPAFRNYLIKTDINVDVSIKKTSVNIAHILTTPSTIEGDLPNIVTSNYILKQSNDEINKVTLVDLAEENRQYNFYLHSDYTYTSTDTDRLTPVRNDVRVVDSDNITEEEFWYNENRALTDIDKYIEYPGSLTNAELTRLQNAFELIYPNFKQMFDATLTSGWYKQEAAELAELASIPMPFTQFHATDVNAYSDYSRYVDCPWNDEEALSEFDGYYGYRNFTYWIDSYTSAITPSMIEYRNQYKGTLPEDLDVNMARDHIYVSDQSAPDETRFVITDEISSSRLWWWHNSRKVSLSTNPSEGTVKTYIRWQKTNDSYSHIHLKLPFQFGIRAHMIDYETDPLNYIFDSFWKKAYINIPVTYSMVSSLLDKYKKTAAYIDAYNAYKQNQLNYILEGYVKKNFAAAKYVNNIELVVLRDDSMLHPKSMRIGQEINIIHNGTTYSSILTGKEYLSDGKVKLIFGTIRVDLTKMLKLNQ